MNHLMSRIVLQNNCRKKYQFYTKARASQSLVSQVKDMLEQNIKIKYLMFQIPTKILQFQTSYKSEIRIYEIRN